MNVYNHYYISNVIMKKVVIIHGIWCHYHVIGALLEQLQQDYEIDLLIPPEVKPNTCPIERFDGWSQIYDQMNLKYNVIDKITPRQKYDYCVLDTDNDRIGTSYYDRYFSGTPIVVIQHSCGETQDSINPVYKKSLWILGGQAPLHDYYFFGYHYLNIEAKMRLLTPRISVAIVGGSSHDIENSPQSLEKHLSNFKEIEFYIIHREQPHTYDPSYENIKYLILCDTPQMNYIVARAHYVWFYTSTRRFCTAVIPLAYSALCRCVLHNASRNQYGIQTPIFGGDDDRFTLPPLTHQEVTAVSNERDYLINQSQQAIRRRLVGDPVICGGDL